MTISRNTVTAALWTMWGVAVIVAGWALATGGVGETLKYRLGVSLILIAFFWIAANELRRRSRTAPSHAHSDN